MPPDPSPSHRPLSPMDHQDRVDTRRYGRRTPRRPAPAPRRAAPMSSGPSARLVRPPALSRRGVAEPRAPRRMTGSRAAGPGGSVRLPGLLIAMPERPRVGARSRPTTGRGVAPRKGGQHLRDRHCPSSGRPPSRMEERDGLPHGSSVGPGHTAGTVSPLPTNRRFRGPEGSRCRAQAARPSVEIDEQRAAPASDEQARWAIATDTRL